MEVQLGEKIGIDLKLKLESEHKFTDLANFLHVFSHHHPLTLLSLPLPLMTVRSHSVSLIYNPSTSATKEASFVMSVGKILSSFHFTFTFSGHRLWKEGISQPKVIDDLPIVPS